VHPLANARNDVGEAPADLSVTGVQLKLKRSPDQESALQELIANLHSPGSASYHRDKCGDRIHIHLSSW
jgi:hypothetical protein